MNLIKNTKTNNGKGKNHLTSKNLRKNNVIQVAQWQN